MQGEEEMLRAVLVDNEKLALSLLEIVLSECGQVEVVGQFTKTSKFLEEIKSLKPDVAFLDIEMPGISGIELAMKICEIDDEIDIVFVTAYDHYALDAFRVNAIDYILKPVNMEAISRTVERLIKRGRRKVNIKEAGLITKVKAFGEFSVISGKASEPIRWTTAKVEEIFAHLLLNEKKWISKWVIIEMIWPDSEPKKAEQNLYTTISRLKKTLLDSGIDAKIQSNEGYYQLQIDNFHCDIKSFEGFLSKKLSLTEGTLDEFERAVLLYRGDLFGDKAYSWCIVERERYYESYSQIVKEIACFYMKKMNYKKAVSLLKMLLVKSSYDEEARELFIEVTDLIKDGSVS